MTKKLLIGFFMLLICSITSAEDNVYNQVKELFKITSEYIVDNSGEVLKYIGEREIEPAKREFEISIGLSPFTQHLMTDNLNEGFFSENQLVQLGVEKNNISITFTYFENSYYNESYLIMIDKKYYRHKEEKEIRSWFLRWGLGVVKGYERDGDIFHREGNTYYSEKSNFVLFDDIGVIGTVGIGYTYKKFDFSIDFFGECAVLGIEYKI